MIEAWWRQLKHQRLFLNELDSATSVRKLVGFYVEQHNTVVLHFTFQGQPPDEIYFGTGASVPFKLKEKRTEARAARLAHNRAVTCARCKVEDTKPAMVMIGSNTS
jgi:putative transposase